MKRRISSQLTRDAETENKKIVIPSAVEESPRSRPGQQRLQRAHGEEILRYTQDDSKEENKKSVIPSAAEESPRSRQGQQRLQRAHSEEILRYTQDDSKEENKKTKQINNLKKT